MGWLTLFFMATGNKYSIIRGHFVNISLLIKGTRVQENLYKSVTIYSLEYSAWHTVTICSVNTEKIQPMKVSKINFLF